MYNKTGGSKGKAIYEFFFSFLEPVTAMWGHVTAADSILCLGWLVTTLKKVCVDLLVRLGS